MGNRAFEYADYHRTVIGFHGTSVEAADRLVGGESFKASDKDDEWFGKGIYFWEYAPKQAWWWAKTFKKRNQPAVVGAIIRLGNCFDLLDPKNIKTLVGFYNTFKAKVEAEGIDLPKNFRQHRISIAPFLTFCTMNLKRLRPQLTPPGASTCRRPTQGELGLGAGFMTMRTSKSASVTRKTSSRSGIAGKTGVTAKRRPPRKRRGLGKYAEIIARLEKMPPKKFREALLSAGIITKEGKLRAKYARGAKS